MGLPAKIVRRKLADLLLAVEALVLLAFFRVCLAVIPVRRIIRAITHGNVTSLQDRDGMPVRTAGSSGLSASPASRVQWAVSAVARHSPVEFVCFPQTLAGYTMLRWRGVPSTMVYGVGRSTEGELNAHTWLMVGDSIVVGGETSGEFSPIERWT